MKTPRLILAFISLAIFIAFSLLGCGGRNKSVLTGGELASVRNNPQVNLPGSTIHEQLEELSALTAPDGVNPSTFEMLKQALAEALNERRSNRIVFKPPTGPSNRARNLRLINTDGAFTLRWNYTNVGDYNQDGAVTIADVLPLAREFRKPVTPDNEWIDGDGDGSINISDVKPLADNFFSVCEGYKVQGSDSSLFSWTEIGTITRAEATGPGTLTFNFEITDLSTYQTFRVIPYDNQNIDGEPSEDTLHAYSLTISGTVEWNTGGGVNGANVTVTPDNYLSINYATTGADGKFEVPVAPGMYPVKILTRVSYTEPDTNLELTGFKWTDTLNDVVAIPPITITLTDPANSELTVSGGQAQNADGSIVIEGLDASIAKVWAESYDPDENPEAFPGSYEEGGLFSLNSSVYMWATAQDTSGSQVEWLFQPATVKLEIPQTQWRDLTDINAGNGRIDVPIYDFEETSGEWVASNDG